MPDPGDKIRVGVIGYGYWGPNLVRNFAESGGARVIAVSDMKPDRRALVEARYPGVRATSDAAGLLADPALDAVAIATPVSTHFELGMKALAAGKHVFMEKPLAATAEQAMQLIEEAERRRRALLVDHTFVYTGAVRKIRELVEQGGLGDIYYYDSARVNLGLFQHDTNVIWDLAVHDLSIMDFVLPARPVAVSATGISHVPGKPENIAFLTLFFEGSLIAHIHVNWLAPVKLRRTLIGASQKMIVYDDLDASEKVKVYDKGITVSGDPESLYRLLVGYRAGDMWAPRLDTAEALQTEVRHFLGCVRGQEKPLSGGPAGLRVVRILEAATRSMSQRGRPVELARDPVTA
ncbi:MAG TPA: Gfo/Idh/MocA family oxidoreductase [Terriglobales bacterium]|nr:Gfo/Idh/MocA family oxidoreductase [Terriglobales bacterium]